MKPGRTAAWSIVVVALAFLAWMAFIGDLSAQDMALGAACALFCGAASLLTWRAMGLSIAFDLRDLLQLWRLPWIALHDAWSITCALGGDLLHLQAAGSHFRAVPFHEQRNRRGRLRHVLAVAYTSVTPNSIVIGIDTEQKLLLFHQIVPAKVSAVTRRLGAQA